MISERMNHDKYRYMQQQQAIRKNLFMKISDQHKENKDALSNNKGPL